MNVMMALNFCSVSSISHLTHAGTPQFLNPKSKHLFKLYSSSSSGGTDGEITEEDPPTYSGSFSSARTQLDLLDQLTSSVDGGYESSDGGYSSRGLTIRDQLAQLVGDVENSNEFTIPLGKNLKKVSPKFLTVSQKRNIRRQTYLNEVSRRNDTVFFATIGAFVIFPPLIILGIAIATGYVQLLP